MPELPKSKPPSAACARCLRAGGSRRSSCAAPDLRRPFPPDLGQRLTGAPVTALGRRAKYGLIDTDRGDTLIFHLGMSGRWRIDPAEIGKHDHVLIETEEGRRLAPQRSAPIRLARSGRDRSRSPLSALRERWARAARAGFRRRAFCSAHSTGGPRRSRRCCSTSESWLASATSMSAKRSHGEDRAGSSGGRYRCRDLTGWSRRYGGARRRRSRPAVRRCATMPGPMASSAISPAIGRLWPRRRGLRLRRGDSPPGRFGADRPSSARNASAKEGPLNVSPDVEGALLAGAGLCRALSFLIYTRQL